MAKRATANRITDISEAALRVFTKRGFKNAQVADVAKEAGVAAGTIYLYANSKEALFWLALQHALGDELQETTEAELDSETVLARLREIFKPGVLSPSLDKAINELHGLEEVIGGYWDVVDRLAPSLRLIERCAPDWPGLFDVFFYEIRINVIERLTRYLIDSAKKGHVRQLENPALSARLIIETVAWFSMHRRGDADGHLIPDADAKAVTLDALVHAYQSK